MGVLNRKLIRDLRQSKGQFISVLAIVIIGVMFYSGINATFKNLSGASDKYYGDYRFGDLWASFAKAPESIGGKVAALPYMNRVTVRIVQDVKLDMPGENAVVRLITMPDKKKEVVNDVLLKSGGYFTDDGSNQCLVEEEFYKAHNLKAGDTISPVINGKEVRLKVIGSVKSPEYVYTLKDGSELMPDSGKFGIVYVKMSFGQAVLGYQGSINDLSVTLKDGTDADKAKDDLKKMLDRYGVKEVIKRDDQLSNNMLSQEMKQLKSMAGTFPIVFFIVAAAIIYITMGRMVENQRAQIGVLKAFGFSNWQILLHYLSYSAFIAILGSMIGSLMGMLLGKGFTTLENAYFHLPPADMKLYPELVIPASLLTLLFCLLAGYNSCKRVFRIMPSEAMRPRTPAIGKKILLEKAVIVWKSISYGWKIVFRNVFRYKRRAALTSIGIVFATAITVIGFGMKDSVDFLVKQQYTNIQNYDIKVNFSKFISIDDVNRLKSLAHVTQLEPVVETGVEISNGWRKKDTGYTALVNNPGIYRVVDKSGESESLPDNGILLPEKLAKSLGVKPYDDVYIKLLLPGMEKKEARIKGTVEQYIGNSAYGSIDGFRSLTGDGLIANSAVIRIDSESNERQVVEHLREMPLVSSVQSKSDSLNNLMKNMGAMTSSIGVMILLAAVLSVAVIYNIATINIFERQRELATLKVLGFKDNEVRSLIFNENYLITLFGIVLGLPLGLWLGNLMMSASQTDVYNIPFVVGNRTYILAALMTVGFTVLANLTLMKKVRNINMIEVLKSNE